jgi:hypothetical protein
MKTPYLVIGFLVLIDVWREAPRMMEDAVLPKRGRRAIDPQGDEVCPR